MIERGMRKTKEKMKTIFTCLLLTALQFKGRKKKSYDTFTFSVAKEADKNKARKGEKERKKK